MQKILIGVIALALAATIVYAANEPVSTWVGIAPGNWTTYSSGAAENSKAVQASQSTLLSACLTNMTTNDLVIMVFNSTTVPADGAVTPIGCGPVPKATATLVSAGCYTPPAPINMSTGISVAVSSGVTCYTKTTPGGSAGMFTVQYK